MAVKADAARLGLSAVGVAAYDHRYTWAQAQGREVLPFVVVCVLEQSYGATQTAPSVHSERAAFTAYSEVMELAVALGQRLEARGYRARVSDPDGPAVYIHYGVAAGLGQLGLNGQLLTPGSGSRCRLVLIETDAPLALDAPVDYGIPALCDTCQVCVRRCPSGAIPNRRAEHRGVEKAKIRMDRCLPVVSQAEGCAVCMKVCPVQKYGLTTVLEHWEQTGAVLGKDTDALEGYTWPRDGRRYGPGEKPRLEREFLSPPGLSFDKDRLLPAEGQGSIYGDKDQREDLTHRVIA